VARRQAAPAVPPRNPDNAVRKTLLLRLLGRDPDPAKSKEHVLLSILAERRLLAGENADIAALLGDLDKVSGQERP
jgi:hypothetical protein